MESQPRDFQLSLRQLTADPAVDYFPSWSPDGRSIVFSSDREGQHLWIVAADGGDPRRLTSIPANHPRWSPEGSFIAFDADRGTSLMIVRPEGGVPVKIPTPSLEISRGAFGMWSSDGSTLTFSASGEIWAIDLPTGELTQVFARKDFFARAFSYSPDGRWLAVDADADPNKREDDVWLISTGGEEPRRLTDRPGREGNPVFSPDGSMIAYMASDESGRSLWVMNAEGNRQVQITEHSGFNANPRWSPDGKSMAFSSDRGGSLDIWVMELDLGALRSALD
jgi:TolB protein